MYLIMKINMRLIILFKKNKHRIRAKDQYKLAIDAFDGIFFPENIHSFLKRQQQKENNLQISKLEKQKL